MLMFLPRIPANRFFWQKVSLPLVLVKSCNKVTMSQTKLNHAMDDSDIVWMDIEMTGLDVHKDKILEVSCLITDKDLNIKSAGLDLCIKHDRNVLDNMNEWCMKHHYDSGLVEKCLKSNTSLPEAEQLLLTYLKENVCEKKCPLAGNSVYMDRMFLREYMPIVDDYLHYRIIDVSTIKELARRWNPISAMLAPKKQLAHRSLDDIQDSILELQFYREFFFRH